MIIKKTEKNSDPFFKTLRNKLGGVHTMFNKYADRFWNFFVTQ